MHAKKSLAHKPFPGPEATFGQVLTERAVKEGSRVAYRSVSRDGEEVDEITYAELLRRTTATGDALRECARPGDRAILMCGPGLDFITGVLACLAEGIIAVPVFPAPNSKNISRTDRLAGIWEDASPAVALTTTADRTRSANSDGPWRDAPALLLDEFGVNASSAAAVPGAADVNGESVAILQYTSGSTTRPKGVVLSHKNLVANAAAIQQARSMTPEDVGVFWLPPHHDMGLIGGILVPLYVGMTSMVMPPALFVSNPLLWLELISKYRGSISAAPNFALSWCIENVKQSGLSESIDLSSMRFLAVGAEPVRRDTVRAFYDALARYGFPLTAIVPSYGLAEATLMVSCIREGDVPRAVEDIRDGDQDASQGSELGIVSCGVEAPRQEVSIHDPLTGRECHEGEEGEIWVRGPSVAHEYWRNEHDTESTFDVDLVSGVASCRTGDEGFLLNGHLFISGRLKEVITVRGQNIHPEDVEHVALSSLPAGARSLCFGYDDGTQEQVVIVVEGAAKDNFAVTAETVRTAVLEYLAISPTAVLLVRQRGVPLTTSGKVQRGVCKERYLAGTLPIVAGWVDNEAALPESAASMFASEAGS